MSKVQIEITRHNFPCKDCKERCIGCHGECPKYIAAKEEHDEQNDRIRESKDRESIVYDFKKKAIAATIRNAGRKRR